jgi:hypothetical protein
MGEEIAAVADDLLTHEDFVIELTEPEGGVAGDLGGKALQHDARGPQRVGVFLQLDHSGLGDGTGLLDGEQALEIVAQQALERRLGLGNDLGKIAAHLADVALEIVGGGIGLFWRGGAGNGARDRDNRLGAVAELVGGAQQGLGLVLGLGQVLADGVNGVVEAAADIGKLAERLVKGAVNAGDFVVQAPQRIDIGAQGFCHGAGSGQGRGFGLGLGQFQDPFDPLQLGIEALHHGCALLLALVMEEIGHAGIGFLETAQGLDAGIGAGETGAEQIAGVQVDRCKSRHSRNQGNDEDDHLGLDGKAGEQTVDDHENTCTIRNTRTSPSGHGAASCKPSGRAPADGMPFHQMLAEQG